MSNFLIVDTDTNNVVGEADNHAEAKIIAAIWQKHGGTIEVIDITPKPDEAA